VVNFVVRVMTFDSINGNFLNRWITIHALGKTMSYLQMIFLIYQLYLLLSLNLMTLFGFV
jgi:hypothetical protein